MEGHVDTIVSDTAKIHSDTDLIYSDTTIIYSDTTHIDSDIIVNLDASISSRATPGAF